MRYRKLSSTGDYVFGNGQEDFYRDVPEAPAQAVQTRLLLWQTEWFLNVDEGVPYLQGILGKGNEESASIILRSTILQTQGVLSLSDYSNVLNRETRKFSVSATIDTIYGTTTLQAGA